MALIQLDPITQKRFAKFRKIKRGWYALWILGIAYVISLGSELFIGNRPLYVSHGGEWYAPAFTSKHYPVTLFGGKIDLGFTDFRALAEDQAFLESGGRVILPLHPYSPFEQIVVPGDRPPARPLASHPFGTDRSGRDVLARLVYGFRTSMSFSLVLTAAATVVGVLLGAVQGYFGGWMDLIGQRLTEVWIALPFLYVVLLVSSVFKPNFMLLVVILTAFSWIGISRYVRGEVLRERQRDYVAAARALGASWNRVLFNHVVGNSMTPVITLVPFTLVNGLFALTALDYLGYGLPAPTPSWGELFQQGRGDIRSWWLIMFPFAALFTTLLLSTFVGEALREAWDPKDHHAKE